MKRKITAFLLTILLTIAMCSCTSAPAPTNISKLEANADGALNVHFIDVGQGDCSLLESDGVYVLIDAGEKEYEDSVCKYLKENGVKTIDYVIATHPHSDHCGSLTKVINTFSCKNFITTQTDHHTKTWVDVLNAVDQNNVNYIDAKVGSTYSFGQSQFEILGPYSNFYEAYNNYSVVLKATCGSTSFLFTGDAEKLVESEMISNGANLKADVLKVGHHGSSTSSSRAFIKAVDPDTAVISCGKDNDYGHPHQETLNELENRNITIFRTDELSTIIASSDTQNISFYYTNNTNKPSATDDTYQYVGNKSSKKFHLPSCESVADMSDKNKVYFDSKKQASDEGYIPCKQCKP